MGTMSTRILRRATIVQLIAIRLSPGGPRWSAPRNRSRNPGEENRSGADYSMTSGNVTFQAGILRQKGSFDGFLYAPGK